MKRNSKFLLKCIIIFLVLICVTSNLQIAKWRFSASSTKSERFFSAKNVNNDSLGKIESNDFPVSNYFRLLNTPTGVCRKLVRVGGLLQCRLHNNVPPLMDGDKMICMDPEMKIGASPKTEECTVLSFGISTDYSFDLSIRDANCEVHMFDLVDKYNPKLNISYMSFHKIGIGPESKYIYSIGSNLTVEINTLDYILHRFKLTNKVINVLKMDIEGGEWSVLEELIKNNLLASVGQIAIELHYEKFSKIKTGEKEVQKDFQKMITTLQNLEEVGFRRISYLDNVISTIVKDEEGNKHTVCGELLLVNSNWYNDRPLNL